MFGFQSPIKRLAPETCGAMVPSHRICPSPEAGPHGLLKSNRSRSAAGSVGEGVVTFAATDLGAPALGAGIVSPAAWFDVTLRSRLRLYCPVPLWAKIAKLLNEALPFHSIKKRGQEGMDLLRVVF